MTQQMQAPVLKIRKKVLNIQGRDRSCVQVQADLDPVAKAALQKHFNTVVLFKRSMYVNGTPEGAPLPEASLAPHLATFLKDDACPEIMVKSILAGQLYQADGPWEVLCFEYIAKRAFDALVLILVCVGEMGTETCYAPCGTEPLDVVFGGGVLGQQAVSTEAAADAPDAVPEPGNDKLEHAA